MSRITVVGSFSMDLTVTMSQFPKEGQTIIGKKMLKNPGGKGANQCIAAARLGGDVEMIGMVGNDENGRIIKDLYGSILKPSPIPAGWYAAGVSKSV